MTTNYHNTFITVSPDSHVEHGLEPKKAGTIAQIQYGLLRDKPYAFSSDDLLFEVYARRNRIAASDRIQERETFFTKSHACLRASALVRQYGWGLHHDDEGKVAAYGIETDEYRKLTSRSDLKVVPGMRSHRS